MQFDDISSAQIAGKVQLGDWQAGRIVPPAVEPKHSAWTAPFRAVPAAVAEAAAGLSEAAVNIFETGRRGGAVPMLMRGESLTSVKGETELSRSLRNAAESYAPDPATAGEAERLVFGLTRGIGKAVAYGVTTGPAAPLLFGADEGLTQMDALQRQGVDTATAAKAGGVAAAVNTAGFLIPVAGKTVVSTIGLGTLSGPASFIAQQASTREILRAADYGKIAEQFDPFDPVGLGASLLPFGFGAWAMRGKIKGARPAAEPAQPAAITSPADSGVIADPAPPVADAAPVGDTVSPVARPEVAQERVDAAMVHNLTLAADHVEATRSTPLETLDQFAARTLPKDAKAVREGADPFLGWLKDNGGVNFADKFDITGEAGGIRMNRGGVFKNGGRGLDELAQIAEAEGWLPPGSTNDIDGGVPALRDMLQRSMQGERIYPLAEQYQRQAADMAMQQRTAEGEALGQRLQMLGVDPAPAMGNPDVLRAYLDQHEPRLLRQALADIADTTEPIPQPQPIKATPPDVPQPAQPEPQASPQTQPQAAAQGTGPAATAAREAGAVAQALRSRADQVVATAPDLVVGMTEDGAPITARQELERIKREAMEGTDDTLGGNDAKLVDVAVKCALSFGE